MTWSPSFETQQAGVDEDTGQLVADGFDVAEQRYHGGIDPAR